MTEALGFFVTAFKDILFVFDCALIDFYGYTVSLGSILMVFIALGAIISIFWRGARG